MSEIEQRQVCQEMGFKKDDISDPEQIQWVFMETKDDVCKYDLIESDLDDSLESSSSLETIEDASSSSGSPLFELSELMAQLPIKRGLSKFYQGKSESFSSITSVTSVEDLAKKEKYCCKSRRSTRRYGQGQLLSPKATIAKDKRGSSSSSITTSRSSIFSSLGKMSSLVAN